MDCSSYSTRSTSVVSSVSLGLSEDFDKVTTLENVSPLDFSRPSIESAGCYVSRTPTNIEGEKFVAVPKFWLKSRLTSTLFLYELYECQKKAADLAFPFSSSIITGSLLCTLTANPSACLSLVLGEKSAPSVRVDVDGERFMVPLFEKGMHCAADDMETFRPDGICDFLHLGILRPPVLRVYLTDDAVRFPLSLTTLIQSAVSTVVHGGYPAALPKFVRDQCFFTQWRNDPSVGSKIIQW